MPSLNSPNTQARETAAAVAAVRLLLDEVEKGLPSLPPGACHDVRISIEAVVDGVRIYAPIATGGLVRTARKSGRVRFERRKNYKG
jgi:hypothetical protein